MKMSRRLICIHGFLGQKSDWDFLKAPLDQASVQLEAVSLEEDFRQYRLDQASNAFESWAECFARSVREECAGDLNRPLLLGYSMGGRLAMEALARSPDLFGGAFFVSTHPGLRPGSHEAAQLERQARVASDERWATRFESEAWESLIQDWNAQSVFQGGRGIPHRKETELNRRVLAGQLRGWSLGKQVGRLAELSQLELPILWMVGEQDERYVQLSREVEQVMAKKARFEVQRVPQAGHRVPWDQPELFCERVLGWANGSLDSAFGALAPEQIDQ